jgi:ABC-type multidrug transport system fused ATPase/permease subunit
VASGRHARAKSSDHGWVLRLPGLGRSYRAWRKLRPIAGKRLLPIATLGAISIAAGVVEASVLALLADVAAEMVLKGRHVSTGLGPLSAHLSVGTAIVAALILAVVRLVLQLVLAWLPSLLAANVQAELRGELFEAFTRASWAVKSNELEGQFQELMTNQINIATGAVMNMAITISASAMFVALVATAFTLSVPVAALVLVSAVALFWAFRPINRAGRAAARDESEAYVNQATGISEAVRLAEEAQVFGVIAAYQDRMSKLIEIARVAFFRQNLTARAVGNLYQSCVYLIIVGGIGGLYLSHAGDLASLGAVVLILVRASTYGQQITSANHALIQSVPYLDRLYGALERYRRSAGPDSGSALPRLETLAFDKVTFGYRLGQPVLKDISFDVRAGEAIGVIGPTGAGKSTLSQLLLRLREPEAGVYLVNGVPSGTLSRTDWQRKVAYVPQEPRLFRGSVSDNIRFFRDIDQGACEYAARLAHVHDEIVAMPAGYKTIIGQQADAVSGGQRQRICLARALAGKPQLLVLDEPTSALDLESEAAIEASLAGLHGTMTTFIIAHRLSVLRVCDRLLVLEGGRVSAFGAVTDLAISDAFYQRVVTLAATPP